MFDLLQMTFSSKILINKIRQIEKKAATLSESGVLDASLHLKYRAMTGVGISKLLPEAFALVLIATRRTLGFAHHDVQLHGGIQLARNRIAEMKTGEGKTITAILPTFLHALSGRSAHVLTVNDYLATRDQETTEPIFRQLGISSAFITPDQSPAEKSAAYRANITYASVKELGFDFLRDRIASHDAQNQIGMLPPFYFGLIDEADSVLLDEAKTPLIIGIQDMADKKIMDSCYRWSAEHVHRFLEDRDYYYDVPKKKIDLSYQGQALVRALPSRESTNLCSLSQLYETMEKAIKVNRDFQRGVHYDVIDGEAVIIDEYTGRPAEGRQWQAGIHQCVEAKEKIEISAPTKSAATITIQDLLSLYPFMAGMTGTAKTAQREFKKVYRKRVSVISPNRPVRRSQVPTRVLAGFDEKLDAVVTIVQDIIANNRAVLVGTRAVEISERVSEALAKANIPHDVLNSRNLERESEIVSLAGRQGAVTVATNMAGRGTDIKLDDVVRKNGGLHVILTEIHESERIDWQLIGRGARQGDPGSFQFLLSMEDEILKLGLDSKSLKRIQRAFNRGASVHGILRYFRQSQTRLERKNLIDRLALYRHHKDRAKTLREAGQDPILFD